MKEDLAREEENESKLFKEEDQALLFTKCPRVYSRDSRRKSLLYASVLEMRIYFWRKEATGDKVLQVASYEATENIVCHHLK